MKIEPGPQWTATGEVAPGVHRVTDVVGDRACCVFAVLGAAGCVLVDTGVATTPDRILVPYLQRLGIGPGDVTHVVVTHADVDHSGGLGAIQRWAPRAAIVAHEADRLLIEDVDRLLDARYREFRHEHDLDQDAEFIGWVRRSADDGRVTKTLDEAGATLDLGDRRLLLRHAPGHTAGHLVVTLDGEGCSIIGDALLGPVAMTCDATPAFAPTYRYVDAYRTTLTTPLPELVLTSHFPALRGGEVEEFVVESSAAVARNESAVLEVLGAARDERSTGEILAGCAALVRSWPPAADMTLAQPVVGHLEDLRRRGQVERRPGRPALWATPG